MLKSDTPISATLEPISKMVTIIIIAVYLSGFLVVSLHNTSFGFIEMNPFKPKILTAGTLFLFLTFLPILPTQKIFEVDKDLRSDQKILKFFIAAVGFYVACQLTALLLTMIYAPPSIRELSVTQLPDPFSRFDLFHLIRVIGLVIFLITLILASIASKCENKHQKKLTVLIATLLTILVITTSLLSPYFIRDAMHLWFFGIGIMAVLVTKKINSSEILSDMDIQRFFLLIVLSVLTIFSTSIYPRIKSAWGGGSPIPVAIYFQKDSRILPGQELHAEMLDESENGFFILPLGESKALFLPRSSVAAISFSNNGLDPKLFKKNK